MLSLVTDTGSRKQREGHRHGRRAPQATFMGFSPNTPNKNIGLSRAIGGNRRQGWPLPKALVLRKSISKSVPQVVKET
jgi:hypothetical protein